MFRKNSGNGGRLLHDLSEVLMFGRPAVLKPRKEIDDEVRDVIAGFNAFIAAGTDPHLFEGFARMRYSEEALDKAYPVIRELIANGAGVIYANVGAVDCRKLGEGIKRLPLRPTRVIASPICQTCTLNDNGRCRRVKAKISNIVAVTQDDVDHVLSEIRTRGLVPRKILSALLVRARNEGNDPQRVLAYLHRAVVRFGNPGVPRKTYAKNLSSAEVRDRTATGSMRRGEVRTIPIAAPPVALRETVEIRASTPARQISSVATIDGIVAASLSPNLPAPDRVEVGRAIADEIVASSSQ